MRFLVLGCNGMAGHTVSLYLKSRGYDVEGVARKQSPIVRTIVGDVTDRTFMDKTICGGSYDTIVNCVGILNRQAEDDKEQATYVNAYFPHYLEKISADKKTQIIHMSTDCVFSGKRGHYAENDFKDGDEFYDRSKALGELENEKDFTIRTSIIGPDMNPNGIGLLNWFMQQKNEIYGYLNVKWTGITTLQLAKCIEEIAEHRWSGLCNVVTEQSISKYELLNFCNDYIRMDKIKIIPQKDPILDKSLISKRELFKIPDYRFMIEELAKWMDGNSSLYPHYKTVHI